MSKYDETFKLAIVKRYLSEELGFPRLARQHGVDVALLRRWVAQYRQHGEAGLRKKAYPHYSAQFKLSVLQRMWEEELSRREVAALFDIRSGHKSLADWERRYHEGGLEALEPRPRGRPRKMAGPPHKPDAPDASVMQDDRSLEDLRRENAYLRAEVAYLKKLDALIQARQEAAQKKRK